VYEVYDQQQLRDSLLFGIKLKLKLTFPFCYKKVAAKALCFAFLPKMPAFFMN